MPNNLPHNLLDMKAISIQFPGVKALDNVDFSLKNGEIHALLGENGAGKSTLIKCLTGVNRNFSGKILLNNQEIKPNNPHDAINFGISTVFQEVNLCPNLSVAENIFAGRQPLRHSQINWRKINSLAADLMARFHLNIDVTRPLSYYSTAIQQMTSIARAVNINAKILILDEPTSSLDDNEVQLLFNVMRDLKSNGMGIIFITHFLDQIYAVSDRMTVLRNGHLIGTYKINELSKFELVEKMVGKDMNEIFNLKRADVKTNADYMLQAEHIGNNFDVKDISFDVKKGELIGFAGLLGSGRTETAQMLFGVNKITHGKLTLDNQEITLKQPFDAIKLNIAFCPEDRKRDGIIGDLSIRENIMLAVQSRKGFMKPMSRQEQIDLANKYIKLLGIATPDCEKKAGELSGGNQQKVILARWMAAQPKVLILDEPTRGIDIGAKAEIQRLMLEMCGEGVSVIFISSELDEIIRCSNRIIVMRDRSKVAELDGASCSQNEILKVIAEGAA